MIFGYVTKDIATVQKWAAVTQPHGGRRRMGLCDSGALANFLFTEYSLIQ
jgi:hypothetical protein